MDFNGVIINDERIQMKLYQDIFKEEGFEMTEADYLACTGMDDDSFIRKQFIRAEKELTEEKIAEIKAKKTEMWRKAIDKEMPLCDGVENFIRKCSQRFALGIASRANRADIEYVLNKIGVRECFTKIIGAEDVTENKPSPQAYLACFKTLDERRTAAGHHPLVHRDCVVIEDAPQGIQGGKNAGMQTLGVTNTFDADILRRAGADSVTKTLADWMPESLILTLSKTA
jgi:HAD superfamily hydrolase (TIGR01509 family)